VNPALRTSAAHVFVDSVEAPSPADDDLHHLVRVLRLRDGERVTVSDGSGNWRVTEMRSGVLVPIGEIETELAPPQLTIAAAIPKGDRLEWMVQKLTELGVARIILVDCARSVVRWDAARGSRQMERLERVAREAAMQSRRVWLPAVDGPVPLSTVLTGENVQFADPAGGVLSDRSSVGSSTVVIGPEGGFTNEELVAAPVLVSLGPLVLRVETAAMVAAVRFLT
jgi:16S rRNA (uracil1498-N3)-methyltransferase